MSETVTPIIKVDVGESTQTVKGLKEEIAKLRDHILNLDKGTDEYAEAVGKLQADQRKLNEVMALTKKEAVALDGSYDALTQQMALLRKEWKATNDEARRNELGKQIDEINGQLKELDGSIGNFQRNVGNYPKEMGKVEASTKDAAVACKSFQQQMSEMNESIEPAKQKFEAVSNIASGVAGGFAAVQGAMGLLGIESENFEKTMIKIQSAMALAQGIGGMKGLVEGIGKAKVAFAGLGTKIKAVSKVMGAAGWIGVIVAATTAIIALVSWMKKTKDNSEEVEKQLEKLSEKHKQMGSNVGNAVGQFKLLQAEYRNLKSVADKQKWIDENAQAFSALGLAINDVNGANKTFIDDAPKIIEALKLQAEAAALNSIYQTAYGEAYAKKRDIDARAKLYKSGYDPTDAEETGAGLSDLKDFQTYTYTATSTYGNTGTVGGTTVLSTVNSAGAQKLKEYAEQRKKAIDTEVNAILTEFTTLQQQANAAIAAVGIKPMGSSSTSSSNTKKEIKIELATDVKDEIEVLETLYKRKIDLAETASFDQKKIDEDVYKLTLEREGKVLEAIEFGIEEAQRLRIEAEAKDIDLQNKIAKEKNATKKKELQAQLKETQELIKKYALVEIELSNAKADQEVVIEQVKYDELKRLRQQNLEEEAKAIEDAERLYQDSLNKLSSTYGTVEKKQRGWFGSLVGSLVGVDTYDEQKQATAQQESDSAYYAQAYQAEQNFLNQKLELKKAALANEENTEDEKIAYLQEIADIELEIQQSKYAEEDRLRQEDLAKEKKKQENVKAIYGASLQATSDLLNGIADAYESNEKDSEENTKKVKNLRIAAATIDMLQGATTAFSTAMQLGPIAGPIVGAANAAAVVAMGIANINKIKNTNADGSSSNGMGSVTPSAGSYSTELPATYTRNITSASETDSLNQDTKVYILESDIQASNKKVQIRENESSF